MSGGADHGGQNVNHKLKKLEHQRLKGQCIRNHVQYSQGHVLRPLDCPLKL